MDDIYDSADQLTAERMCNSEWMHQLQLEREHNALEALMNCKRAGANLDDLQTLASEMGLSKQWRQYEATTQP